MKYTLSISALGILSLLLGCWQTDTNRDRGPFGMKMEPVKIPKNLPPASTEAASRVHSIGQQIIAANPKLGVRPLFAAIGVEDETVFHSGSANIFISDGVVKRCKTDGELAAVLCLELGKLVSEREAQIAKEDREEVRDPLLTPRASDVVGGSVAPDLTQQAELARFQKENPRRRTSSQLPPPPDPEFLARGYLSKSGFDPQELDKVKGLLHSAKMNPKYENQINHGIPEGFSSGLGIPTPTQNSKQNP
jgi:hypothetical protein